ncbi:MAG TPA: hypothetical protein VGR90_10110, partial [Acidimicrobiales bacterium]|nr:hypothetical protein [Acidimicrobiales bacterium]
AAATDAELAAVLGHSRDEEKEHAAMTLEWLRRHDASLDRALRTYLFSEGSILEREHEAEAGGGGAAGAGGDGGEGDGASSAGPLGVGDLRTGKDLL